MVTIVNINVKVIIKIITIIVIIIIINHHYKLFYIVIIVAIIIGKSYSLQEKSVKNYVKFDNKYFSPLRQHSIISHLSYQCFKVVISGKYKNLNKITKI